MSTLYLFIATKTTAPAALPVRSFNQDEYNRRISNTFRSQGGGKLTVGDLKLRPNGNPIDNHLLCNGAAVSRLSFPELFRLLGTTEGAGDGATTFNLPNYLGVTLAVPASAPAQVATASGTVTAATAVSTQPDQAAQPGLAGGSTAGGSSSSGGRAALPVPVQTSI